MSRMLRARPASVLLVLALLGCAGRLPRVDPTIGRTLPPVEVPPPVEGAAYERFIALGDWGTGDHDQRLVARAMARWAAANGLDDVVSVGDNFYPHGVDDVDDGKFEDVFEEVYDHAALQVPFILALGNHDHEGNPDAQVEYSRKNPRWVMPARRFDVVRTLADGTRIHFFIIDTTSLRHEVQPGQLQWLDEALAASDARWKIVVGHHPIYSHSSRGDSARLIARLEPILVARGVDLYLAGHDHVLELRRPIHGVHHLLSGAGGGPGEMGIVEWKEDTLYAASGGGFAAVRVGKDELVIEFVRMDGLPQFAYTIAKAEAPR
jgi:tartrate-resistant acid phosphatase type 5